MNVFYSLKFILTNLKKIRIRFDVELYSNNKIQGLDFIHTKLTNKNIFKAMYLFLVLYAAKKISLMPSELMQQYQAKSR